LIDKYFFQYPSGYLPIIYIKLCYFAVLPVLLIIASYLVWKVVLWIRRRSEEHYTKFIATIALLLFLIHPSLTMYLVDFFNCQTYVDDSDGGAKKRLLADLQILCWDDKLHWRFTFYVALPCLFVWGLGIPAAILVMMRKESAKLDTLAVKQQFGFFFNGYKRNNYFWEIVIMYRKILCIFIAIFVKGKGIILQAMAMLVVILFFIQANSERRPFLNRALNDIENLSLITQLITIFCGIFFISAKDPNSQNFDKNTDFSLDPVSQYIFFFLILGCNIGFFLLWLIKLQDVIKDNLMHKYSKWGRKVYTAVCLWGNKERWTSEVQQRAKDTKKEAIIQNIENVTLFMNQMKDIYVRDIFYEDHKRFLKLLYFIASERMSIDLT
jgi:hypothetical protein